MNRRDFLKMFGAATAAGFTMQAEALDFLIRQPTSIIVPDEFLYIPRQWVNVKDYGALGNGVANDSPAIEQALYHVVQGGTVYFPSGCYNINSSINLSTMVTKHIKYVGDGTTKTIFSF